MSASVSSLRGRSTTSPSIPRSKEHLGRRDRERSSREGKGRSTHRRDHHQEGGASCLRFRDRTHLRFLIVDWINLRFHNQTHLRSALSTDRGRTSREGRRREKGEGRREGGRREEGGRKEKGRRNGSLLP